MSVSRKEFWDEAEFRGVHKWCIIDKGAYIMAYISVDLLRGSYLWSCGLNDSFERYTNTLLDVQDNS